jgi:Ser/Thr protein kinase RdoA (MazF antagonist)
MDGKLVEADWAPLTLNEVRALLAEFPGCGEPVEILSVSPRPFSAASVVRTANGQVFIKRHHRAVRDAEGLREEHRLVNYLLEHGAAVPRVISNISNETAIELGEWTYEVHDVPQGIDLYQDALSWTPFRTEAHARSAGQALARLHLATEGFDAPRRKPRPLVASFTIFAAEDASAEMERYLAARPALAKNADVRVNWTRALELLAPFHAELLSLLPALTPLWTHNDLHASNLLWSDARDDAQAAAIIDFGLADRTNAVHDLAHAIERNIVEWLALAGEGQRSEIRDQRSEIRDQRSEIRDQRSEIRDQRSEIRDQGSESVATGALDVSIHFDHLCALLDGYESVRTLSDEEAAALAPMTALCHAEFALSEADYFLGVLRSEEKAAMASEGWLVGHARWFRGAGGKRLLDTIRKWAETPERRIERVQPS